MPIKYSKLISLLKKKGYTTYKIRMDNLISQSAWQKIRTGTGDIDTRTIVKLCKALNCQPGDIMEYIPYNLVYNGKIYHFEYTVPLENVKNKGNAEYWGKDGELICFSKEIEANDTLESVKDKLVKFLDTQTSDVIEHTPDEKDGE